MLEQLSHHNIVRITDVFVSGEQLGLVMEDRGTDLWVHPQRPVRATQCTATYSSDLHEIVGAEFLLLTSGLEARNHYIHESLPMWAVVNF